MKLSQVETTRQNIVNIIVNSTQFLNQKKKRKKFQINDMKIVLALKNLPKINLLPFNRTLSTTTSTLQSMHPKVTEVSEILQSYRIFSVAQTTFFLLKSSDIRIKVPWGEIAGKWYGSLSARPILMIHGWQDNAGTFDTLIPLLPNHNSYLAIDLPGHGHSSRLPHGIIYNMMNYINVINLIRRHYKWHQLSFCGHSMGAQISTLYAALYPERCDLLICLDAIARPYQGTIEARIKKTQQLGDDFLDLDKLNRLGKEPPSYAYDEMVKRWAEQIKMTPEAIEHLMERGVCASKTDPTRFYFSRDVRLKIMEFGTANFTDDVHMKLLERITAPHLFIKAIKAPKFEGEERYRQVLDTLIAANPKFKWMTVGGGHHCHLSHPTLVSDHISEFINKYRTNDVDIKSKI